ncbi:hypothetical protein [Clostridium sp. ZS2]|uniref:hypothetical protein n=1 Tax=Clostridium sp. ZS2 TaxID=2949988 RepID=UPI0020799328|nr:hypothetical protein [Clostridium sp. ZS2]
MSNRAAYIGYQFEQFCFDLLKYYNIKFRRNVELRNHGKVVEADVIIDNHRGDNYLLELKYYLSSWVTKAKINRALECLEKISENLQDNYINVLVTGSPIDEQLRIELQSKNIEVIDISNLIYLSSSNPELTSTLNSIMNEALYEWEREGHKPSIRIMELFCDNQTLNIKTKENLVTISKLVESFETIKASKKDFRKYEKHCTSVLKFLFEEHLGGWKEQNRTDDDLHQMDLICRVKRGNEFWDSLKEDFDSRYILFEFKNYSAEIKQTQIYTTEKYLFRTALRKVGFIISRKGASKGAYKVIAGILR